MDSIDKEILFALERNCRISYQDIAQNIGISSNAVKKRVTKLLETAVLHGFSVELSRAMTGAELVLSVVKTDGSLDDESFFEEMKNNPMVYAIMPLSTGDSIVMADCVGAKAQLQLGRELRTRKGVTDVEIHPILAERGGKTEITRLQLRVLKCLLEDARMSTVDVSRCSGLTPKRVRRVLQELSESRAVAFTIVRNINTGDSLAFLAQMRWDGSTTDYSDINEKLKNQYPHDYWFAFVSTIEPLLYAVFVVQSIREVEEVYRGLKSMDGILNVTPMLFFPNRIFKSMRVRLLEQMISEAHL